MADGRNYHRCQSCGAVLFQADNASGNNQQLNLELFTARTLVAANEFQRAILQYDSLLEEYGDREDLLWGRVLADYAIQYAGKENDKHPTFNRLSETPIFENSYYKRLEAMLRSTPELVEIKRDEAAEIERIRLEMMEMSKGETNCDVDVFICYAGDDREIAAEIYLHLRDMDKRVFYAPVTLGANENSIEPKVYRGLTTAKLMLIVATSKEALARPWVKNEWQRYLNFMERDRSKHVFVIEPLRDSAIDPYYFSEVLGMPSNQVLKMWEASFWKNFEEAVNRSCKEENAFDQLFNNEKRIVSQKKSEKRAKTVKTGATFQKFDADAINIPAPELDDIQNLQIIEAMAVKGDFDVADAMFGAYSGKDNELSSRLKILIAAEAKTLDEIWDNGIWVKNHVNRYFEAYLKCCDKKGIKKFFKNWMHAFSAHFDNSVRNENVDLAFSVETFNRILPYSSIIDDFDRLVARLADYAVETKNIELADVVEKAYDSNDVDAFIKLRTRMGDAFNDANDEKNATKYYKDVLALDDGDVNALFKLWRFQTSGALILTEGRQEFQNLLEYCDDQLKDSILEQVVKELLKYSSNDINTFDGAMKDYYLGWFANDDNKFKALCDTYQYLQSERFFTYADYYCNFAIQNRQKANAVYYRGFWDLIKIRLRCVDSASVVNVKTPIQNLSAYQNLVGVFNDKDFDETLKQEILGTITDQTRAIQRNKDLKDYGSDERRDVKQIATRLKEGLDRFGSVEQWMGELMPYVVRAERNQPKLGIEKGDMLKGDATYGFVTYILSKWKIVWNQYYKLSSPKFTVSMAEEVEKEIEKTLADVFHKQDGFSSAIQWEKLPTVMISLHNYTTQTALWKPVRDANYDKFLEKLVAAADTSRGAAAIEENNNLTKLYDDAMKDLFSDSFPENRLNVFRLTNKHWNKGMKKAFAKNAHTQNRPI
jgi:hypothetical protein